MIDMKLTRQYFDVKDVRFGDTCSFAAGILTVSEKELQALTADLFKAVGGFHLEITHPGENARIIHVLDTIAPMVKVAGEGIQYSGFFSTPYTVGRGVTNMLCGFAVMESAALPWDESNASSGLLYPRDAIIELSGYYADYTPFSKTHNLVIVYDLNEGKSSMEYDNDIRLIAIRIATHLAELTRGMEPDRQEVFSTQEENPDLPGVVMVWQCQNQGPYANTMLYGMPIDDMVPTVLHPNEMLDGCVVSGNYVWPAFKVPTYLHVNHPVLLELYRRHGKDLNFKGVLFCRSHNPSNWHMLYLLMIIATMGNITTQLLNDNPGFRFIPMFAAAFTSLASVPWLSKLISIAALLALLTTMLVVLSLNARVVSSMADGGMLPKPLAKLNKNGVPGTATVTLAIICMVLSCFPSLTELLVNLGSVSAAITIVIVCASLICARKKVPHQEGNYKAPGGNFVSILTIVLIVASCIPGIFGGGGTMWLFTIIIYAVGAVIMAYYLKKQN